MTSQYQREHVRCAEHITSAYQAIGKPLHAVKTLFQRREVSVIDYSDSDTRETVLEAQVDGATLTSFFGNSDTCECVFLFLDDVADIIHYITYCSKTYRYHYLLQGWVVDGCCVKIDTQHKECNLQVLPIKQRERVTE